MMRSALLIPLLIPAACASYAGSSSSVQTTVANRLGVPWPGDHVPDLTKMLEHPLDVDAAARIALARNPALLGPLAELGLARASLIAATIPTNPRAEGEVRFHKNGDPAVELEVTQSLTDLIYASWARSIGGNELEAAKLRAAGAILGVVADVRRTFYRHQADLQRVDLAKTVLLAGEASYTAAAALHEAGNITDLAYYSERDQLEESKLAFHRAEQSAAASRERLARALGLWGASADFRVDARLPEPEESAENVATAENVALEKNFELDSIRRRIAAVRDRAGLSRVRGVLPDIDVGVSAAREDPEEPWGIGPKIELALPLFDRAQADLVRAEAELELLEQQHRSQAIALRAVVRETAIDLRAAEARVRQYRKTILPLRQRILEETEAAVNGMLASVFDLLRVKRDQVRAANEYLTELESYWMSREALELLLRGGTIAGGERPNGQLSAGSVDRSEGGH